MDNDSRVEEWQLVIKKRNDDPFDVDEIHLNISFSSQVQESQVETVTEDIDRRIFEVSEVRLNSLKVLPLEKILDLLGMETQLKEKRIVDLRMAQTSPAKETMKR
jgi:hypothetical protein